MKSLRSMGLAALALVLAAPFSAQAALPNGWYVGINTNMVFQHEGDSEVSDVTNKIEYKDGWGLSGYTGYGWGNGLRLEGEALYRHSSADTVTGTNAGVAGGGLHNTALMMNALYEHETGMRLRPYIGAGIGGAVVGADNLRTINGTDLDKSKLAFAYQGIAGFALTLSGNWDFTADYRYFATNDVKFKPSVGTKGETENSSHNLMMGIRYTFNEPPKPAAPAPEPKVAAPVAAPVAPKVAAPIVAPVPQSYMVFFDFDKSVLTPEAKRIIASAAADYQKGKYIRVVVTGHTDTMGSVKYNQKLSERRAASVKSEFAKLGLPSAEVSTVGAGENQLLVPTNNQVREAQNRRAEIVFKTE